MPSTQIPDVSVSSLTDGTWRVDPSASEVRFTARGMIKGRPSFTPPSYSRTPPSSALLALL